MTFRKPRELVVPSASPMGEAAQQQPLLRTDATLLQVEATQALGLATTLQLAKQEATKRQMSSMSLEKTLEMWNNTVFISKNSGVFAQSS